MKWATTAHNMWHIHFLLGWHYRKKVVIRKLKKKHRFFKWSYTSKRARACTLWSYLNNRNEKCLTCKYMCVYARWTRPVSTYAVVCFFFTKKKKKDFVTLSLASDERRLFVGFTVTYVFYLHEYMYVLLIMTSIESMIISFFISIVRTLYRQHNTHIYIYDVWWVECRNK